MSKPLQHTLLEELQSLASELDTVNRAFKLSQRAGGVDPAGAKTSTAATSAPLSAKSKATTGRKPRALLQRAQAIAEQRRNNTSAGKQVALPL